MTTAEEAVVILFSSAQKRQRTPSFLDRYSSSESENAGFMCMIIAWLMHEVSYVVLRFMNHGWQRPGVGKRLWEGSVVQSHGRQVTI